MSKFLAVLIVLLVSAHAGASPNEDLNSEEKVQEARQDIIRMKLPELRLYADYLSQCTNMLSKNELIVNQCEVARERYQLEYRSNRALDDIDLALFISGMLIKANEKERSGKRGKEDNERLLRYSDVWHELNDSVRLRFYSIRVVHPAKY